MFFEKIKEINHTLEKIRDKSVAVWCMGRHTEKLLEYTNLLKYDVKFFIDKNAAAYVNGEAYGKTVYCPDEVDFQKIDYIVVSTYRYQKEILSNLKQYGIADKAVVLYSKNDEGEFYLLPREDNADFYFTGNFQSWEEARQSIAEGYEDRSIAEKVLYATRQVMEGKACYERDAVLFYKKDFNFRVASIFGVLASRKSHINVVDFGGALGSEYWKNREFLYKFGTDFTWNVVEQDTYVTLGTRAVSNKELKFYSDISQLKGEKIDFIIMSSVLQYLRDYQSILAELMELGAEYILIDRQIVSEQTRFCVQYVGENIYRASYPLRVLKEKELLGMLDGKYEKVTEFASEVDGARAYVDGKEIQYKGYLLECRKVGKSENT